MKKLLLLLGSFLLSLTTYAAMNISKIDPPFWFTGMNNPELQLMVCGEGIGQASVCSKLSRCIAQQRRETGKQQLPACLPASR